MRIGRTADEVVPFCLRPVPIVATVREAIDMGATALLIGVAPTGGKLDPGERWGQSSERGRKLLDQLEPDERMQEQVCIGESCSRCLHSCPPDAVRQWGLDKAGCATEAQEFGYMTITNFLNRFVDLPPEEKKKAVRSRDLFGFWQGLLRVVGSFGDCPRCLAVCPVGNDYHAHLADIQKHIPEKTPEKVAKAAAFKQARKEGHDLPGLSEWNIRWVGEKGYQGIVARQLQEFKRLQKEKERQ